ncbi:MAG TPA: protein-methionine-sulfoxide reductase heme-binding subunit MsrQ [Gammaproteobacteria bacterium]|nr:protein-methionine-sulfoxide reductase heme-binding subunit MsrQ [Gammaproteobacteria bacterium]
MPASTPRWVVAVKVAVWAACLAPFALLVLRALGVNGMSLGADPVQEILNVCGKTGLNLLLLTLCITPIRRSTGINRLISFRRLLGLFGFFYVVLHFATYAVLDLGLAWDHVLEDIAKRPYITVGFTALVLLIPLAATSTNRIQRALGRRWVKLHRLVYVIAVLGVVHFWWQVKLDISEPLLYAFLLTVLLGVRVQHAWTLRKRTRSVDAKPAVTTAYQRVKPP